MTNGILLVHQSQMSIKSPIDFRIPLFGILLRFDRRWNWDQLVVIHHASHSMNRRRGKGAFYEASSWTLHSRAAKESEGWRRRANGNFFTVRISTSSRRQKAPLLLLKTAIYLTFLAYVTFQLLLDKKKLFRERLIGGLLYLRSQSFVLRVTVVKLPRISHNRFARDVMRPTP